MPKKGWGPMSVPPLTAKKDDLIEMWVRHAAPLKSKPLTIDKMPSLGLPKAVRRGKHNFQIAVSRYRQRVVVITYYYPMANRGYANLCKHVSYMSRSEAGEKSLTPDLFNASSDKIDARATVEGWKNDERHWRIILSPKNGNEMDMPKYVREVMSEIERTTGTKLDWVAAVHEKEDAIHPKHRPNRHAHIIIRGVADDGSNFEMSREYIRHEIRRIAEEVATRTLGQMGEKEVQEFEARQAQREREGKARSYDYGRHPESNRKPKPKERDQTHGTR